MAPVKGLMGCGNPQGTHFMSGPQPIPGTGRESEGMNREERRIGGIKGWVKEWVSIPGSSR